MVQNLGHKQKQKKRTTTKESKRLKKHYTNTHFLQNWKKGKIFVFCVIAFEPIKTHSVLQNDCINFNFVKKYLCSWWKKWLERVRRRPFISPKVWFTVSSKRLIIWNESLIQKTGKSCPCALVIELNEFCLFVVWWSIQNLSQLILKSFRRAY